MGMTHPAHHFNFFSRRENRRCSEVETNPQSGDQGRADPRSEEGPLNLVLQSTFSPGVRAEFFKELLSRKKTSLALPRFCFVFFVFFSGSGVPLPAVWNAVILDPIGYGD